MPRVRGTPETDGRLLETLRKDVGRLGADVRRSGIRTTVGTPFDDLREFYLTTEHRERLAKMGRAKRVIFFTWWVLKGLFLKLTPARRILLLLAFILLFRGTAAVGADRVRFSMDVGWWGVALILLILALELKDKLIAREELEAGRAVQMALMPEPMPVLAGWQIWLFTQPANDVGGDLVDYLQVDAERACVVLGDVAGKGLPAALLMAKLQATLRALAPEFTSVAEIGSRVNAILNRDGLPNRFATLVYLELGPASGRVRILNAGHMPPILLRGSALDELPRGSLALGLLAGATYEEQAADLLPGDTLVAYSDGVTEAMNAEGDFFGDDRFRALLPSVSNLSVAEAGARIVSAVARFVDTARPHDDISLVLLRRQP